MAGVMNISRFEPRPFVDKELRILQTLADQAAIAIENAQAFDEIAKLNETLEGRVEGRTRELRDTQAQLVQSEKMRSLGQLVAGLRVDPPRRHVDQVLGEIRIGVERDLEAHCSAVEALADRVVEELLKQVAVA